MTLKKNIIVLFFFILFHLHATGIKANFLANNIINIPQGNLFSSFSKNFPHPFQGAEKLF